MNLHEINSLSLIPVWMRTKTSRRKLVYFKISNFRSSWKVICLRSFLELSRGCLINASVGFSIIWEAYNFLRENKLWSKYGFLFTSHLKRWKFDNLSSRLAIILSVTVFVPIIFWLVLKCFHIYWYSLTIASNTNVFYFKDKNE